jgi:hypothetical protein
MGERERKGERDKGRKKRDNGRVRERERNENLKKFVFQIVFKMMGFFI